MLVTPAPTFEDNFIFMRLRTLLRDGIRQQILNCFKSNGSGKSEVLVKTYDLIVVEIQNKNQKTIKDEIKILKVLLDDIPCRKIILIDSVERGYKFASETKEEEIKFEDFDENSQNIILKREINFLGNIIQLNRLIDIDLAGKVLDHLILSKIIENDQISIGDQRAFSSIGYVEDCYVERKFRCPIIISMRIIKEEHASMKLFSTGANKEVLMEFGANPDDIVTCQDGQNHDEGIIIPPSDKTDQEYNEIFQSLGDDVHWLHYTRSRLLWVYSKNDQSKLVEWLDFDKKYASDKIALWNEIRFAKIDGSLLRTIIIANNAGMGKSTVLTSLARKMRQLDHNKADSTNYRWIVRVNLNVFADEKHGSYLGNISFNERDTADAIEFVTKMAIPGDSKNNLIIELQRNIFKLSLKKPSITMDDSPCS